MGKISLQKIPDTLKGALKSYNYIDCLNFQDLKTWDEVITTEEVEFLYCNGEEFIFDPKKPLAMITVNTLMHFWQIKGLDDEFVSIQLLKELGVIASDFGEKGKILILDNGQPSNSRKQKFKIHENNVSSFVFTKESVQFFKLIEEKY